MLGTAHPRPTTRIARHLTLRGTCLDEHNVTVFDHIIFALGQDLALCLDGGFIALLLQYLEVVHDNLDKRLLEIAVDDTGSLRGFGAIPYRPLPHLVRTSCEEAAEVERLAHGGHDLRQRGLGADVLELLGSLCVRHGSETLFERDGYGDDRVTLSVLLDPLGNLGKMLVLLSDVVLLTEVDEEYDGLRGKQEQRVDDLDLDKSQRISTLSN
jgi:hypothetical protein